MRPLEFPLLADRDVRSVVGDGLGGHSDADILRHAHVQGRVVLTHDGDFGALVIAQGMPFTGIIYLRPGHISSQYVLEIIKAIESTGVDVEPPFVVVAERKADTVKIRFRSHRSETQ